MDFEVFRDWAFLGLITSVVFVLYNIMVSFREDVKELSRSIAGFKEELARISVRLSVLDIQVEHLHKDELRKPHNPHQ